MRELEPIRPINEAFKGHLNSFGSTMANGYSSQLQKMVVVLRADLDPLTSW